MEFSLLTNSVEGSVKMNKKIRLAILKELEDGNKNFTHLDFGLSEDDFEEIAKFLAGEEMVRGIEHFWKHKTDYSGAQITAKGERYLEENTTLMKAYKGLKEIRDWIPFY